MTAINRGSTSFVNPMEAFHNAFVSFLNSTYGLAISTEDNSPKDANGNRAKKRVKVRFDAHSDIELEIPAKEIDPKRFSANRKDVNANNTNRNPVAAAAVSNAGAKRPKKAAPKKPVKKRQVSTDEETESSEDEEMEEASPAMVKKEPKSKVADPDFILPDTSFDGVEMAKKFFEKKADQPQQQNKTPTNNKRGRAQTPVDVSKNNKKARTNTRSAAEVKTPAKNLSSKTTEYVTPDQAKAVVQKQQTARVNEPVEMNIMDFMETEKRQQQLLRQQQPSQQNATRKNTPKSAKPAPTTPSAAKRDLSQTLGATPPTQQPQGRPATKAPAPPQPSMTDPPADDEDLGDIKVVVTKNGRNIYKCPHCNLESYYVNRIKKHEKDAHFKAIKKEPVEETQATQPLTAVPVPTPVKVQQPQNQRMPMQQVQNRNYPQQQIQNRKTPMKSPMPQGNKTPIQQQQRSTPMQQQRPTPPVQQRTSGTPVRPATGTPNPPKNFVKGQPTPPLSRQLAASNANTPVRSMQQQPRATNVQAAAPSASTEVKCFACSYVAVNKQDYFNHYSTAHQQKVVQGSTSQQQQQQVQSNQQQAVASNQKRNVQNNKKMKRK